MAYISLIKYGFKNSVRFDIIYNRFFRYQKLRINLIKSFTTNIFMICQWYIIYYLLTKLLILEQSFVLSNIVTIAFIIFIVPILALNVFMNHHWRQQTVNEVHQKALKKLKKNQNSDIVLKNITEVKVYVSNMIREYFHSVWFYNLNNLIIIGLYYGISLLGFSLIAIIIKLLYTSIISSMYAFEYMLNGKSLRYRLNFAEKNWCYLMAWNLPAITFLWLAGFPIIIHWTLMEFWTMCQTICSLYIQLPESNQTDLPIMALQRRIVPIITENTFKVMNMALNNKKIE